LVLFKNVAAIAVGKWQEDRKWWAAQLSACNALQWVIARASGHIVKLQRAKPDPYDFKPKFRNGEPGAGRSGASAGVILFPSLNVAHLRVRILT